MYNICTVVGTRPEIIKLSSVIKLLDKYTNQTLVHTGQHYDYTLNQVFFEDLGLRAPNFYLDAKGVSGIDTVALSISKFDELLAKTHFDCVLIYGDTNSCLCAYAAKRRKIPIFHMEAGNRCFDARVPEEINRKIIDHLADVNMVISEHARRNLIQEGFASEFIFKVGSSMPQVLKGLPIEKSNIWSELNIAKGEYFLLSIHREENIENVTYMQELVKLLERLASQRTVIFSTHPKTRELLKPYSHVLTRLVKDKTLILSEPFGFIDYIALQKNAYCTISDSGTIMEESSLLGFPAVTIRDSYERPEGSDEGTLIIGHWDVEQILISIEICVDTIRSRKVVQDYESSSVAEKVLKIIYSMTKKVDKSIYYK